MFHSGAIALARLYPTVRFVLDHFGSPIDIANSPESYAAWLSNITELASLPNVYAKISGLMPVLGLNCQKKKSAEEISKTVFGDLVRDTVRLFGPERCMFGSNFPVSLTWVILFAEGESHSPDLASLVRSCRWTRRRLLTAHSLKRTCLSSVK